MILGEAVVYIKANMMQLTAGLGKARTATKLAMGKMTTNVAKYEKQIKSAGKMMGIAGALITGAFALMVKSAISLEEELAQVSTMLDKSAMHVMPQYKNALQAMSVEFGEATSTLSKGLYDILSASIPPAEALDVLAVSATAAVAGITDTGTAADAITTILNSYGMEASEASTVSDQLFAIVKGGKITFDELAPSIGRAAATSNMAGFSFEDLGASISTITRAGISSNQAMTAVVGILKSFLKPMDDAKDVAEGFGLELNTATLRTIGLTGVMAKLKNASAEQLSAIFGNIRGLKGIAAALGDTEGYARDLNRMYNSLGLTQAAFDKQSEALGFQLRRLKQSFNVIAVTIGDVLIPTVKKMVEWGLKVTANFKIWAEKNKSLIETLTKVGAGLGLVLLGLAPILLILPGLIAGLGLLKVAFIPFLVGGAIVLGISKLCEYLEKVREKTYETRMEFDKMNLARLNAEISEAEGTLKGLIEELKTSSSEAKVFGGVLGISGDKTLELASKIEELQFKLEILKERRKGLTKVEREGAEVTEELTELDKEALRIKKEIAEAMETERKAREEATKAEELANLQKEITARLYELSNTKRQIAINDLDVLKDKYIKAGMAIETINKWYDLEIEKLDKSNKIREETIEQYSKWTQVQQKWGEVGLYFLGARESLVKKVTVAEGLMAKATGKVYDQYYELAKIWKTSPNIQAYFDRGTEAIEEMGEATEETRNLFERLFASIVENAGTTFSILQNAIQGFMNSVESSISTAITSLLNMKKINTKIKEDMEKEEEKHLDEMAKLQNEYNLAVASGDDALAESISNNMDDIKEQHEELMGDMEGDMTTIGGVAKTFWESLKTAAIKALADIIAKMIILKGLMLLFGWMGIPLSLIPGFEKGGGVGFAKGGNVKGFAAGGGTDTIPAMLTPGEYVISKSMVDYIKRTGTITGDLVGAIQSGAKTPTGFSEGGGVGASSTIIIGAGAITINTPKFSEDDAEEMFDVIERKAKDRGLKFATD